MIILAGQYKVGTVGNCVDCVAGKYSMIVGSTTCLDCVAGKYSTTLGNRRESDCSVCPSGLTSLIGSDSESDCVRSLGSLSRTTAVYITVSLPLTQGAFTPQKQSSFRSAIAATAKVLVEDVAIVLMKDVLSRRSGYSLHVTTEVLAQDDTSGRMIASSLEDMVSLNTKLESEGLSGASLVSGPVVQQTTGASSISQQLEQTPANTDTPENSHHAVTIIGSVVGLVVTVAAAACWRSSDIGNLKNWWLSSSKHQSRVRDIEGADQVCITAESVFSCEDLTRDSLNAKSPKPAALNQRGEACVKLGSIGEGPATPDLSRSRPKQTRERESTDKVMLMSTEFHLGRLGSSKDYAQSDQTQSGRLPVGF